MFSQYTLKCIDGPLAGLSFHFPGTGTCQIGRRKSCDLTVREMTVSGYHCQLISDGKQILLRDNRSTNGTSVNGMPVSEALLRDDDIFTIGGRCSFRISIDEETEELSGEQEDFVKEESSDRQEEAPVRDGEYSGNLDACPGNVESSIEQQAPSGKEESSIEQQAPSGKEESPIERQAPSGKEESAGEPETPVKNADSEAHAGSSMEEESGECRCELCGRIFPARDRLEGVNICPHCMDHNQEAVLRFLLADAPPSGKREKEVSVFGLKGYRSLRKLGEGSFGSVWLVEELASGRHMALKVMLDRATVQDLEIKKFQREMNIASQLDHPNIVGLYKSGSIDGRFYMLQEYCAGGSLFSFIERSWLRYAGKLPVNLSVNLELQILDALDYAHNAQVTAQNILGATETLHGVIHRDIHPGNIFLAGHTEPLQIKVGDWGLSKAYEMAGLSGISVGDVPTGTQDFACLQQHMNFRYSGPEVDVWSAAAILFYMLTGQPPRGRDLFGGAGHGTFPRVRPVRSLRPDIPPALAEVLDYTLVEQPRLRVLSASELSGRIREAMREAD